MGKTGSVVTDTEGGDGAGTGLGGAVAQALRWLTSMTTPRAGRRLLLGRIGWSACRKAPQEVRR